MIPLTLEQLAELRTWFLPEKPGPLVGLHVLNTGHGRAFADRWPAPQVLYVDIAGNGAVLGEADAVTPAALRTVARGFIDARPEFAPLLKRAFPDLIVWPRLIYTQPAPPRQRLEAPPDFTVRRLQEDDAPALAAISHAINWIAKTWKTPRALAASGMAWGAFAGHRLVAVANTFFLGDRYEDVGVVTEPDYRSQGLSASCVAGLCADIHGRGHIPSWSTSHDNRASQRVAGKAGFQHVRDSVIYVADSAVP